MSESSGALVTWAKRIGLGLGGLVAVILVAYGVVYAVSESQMNEQYDVQVAPLEVEPSPALVARGKEIATFRGCRDCHGENLAGRLVGDDMPVIRLAGPNITPAGVVANYTDEDWARTIRHGVKPNGKPTLFMPSYEWTALSHDDMAALIAYAKSVPPAEDGGPGLAVGPMGRVLFLAGQLPLVPAAMMDHTVQPEAPERGPTAEYGRYLSTGCIGCHGKNLAGGPIPGVPPEWPPAANLTAHDSGLASWTFEHFRDAMRTGKRPDGTLIREQYMPWKMIGESSDEDLLALYKYLRTVQPNPIATR